MNAEIGTMLGVGVALGALFVAYSQFIVGRMDRSISGLRTELKGEIADLRTEVAGLRNDVVAVKEAVAELKGRMDELSSFVRALLPPRAA